MDSFLEVKEKLEEISLPNKQEGIVFLNSGEECIRDTTLVDVEKVREYTVRIGCSVSELPAVKCRDRRSAPTPVSEPRASLSRDILQDTGHPFPIDASWTSDSDGNAQNSGVSETDATEKSDSIALFPCGKHGHHNGKHSFNVSQDVHGETEMNAHLDREHQPPIGARNTENVYKPDCLNGTDNVASKADPTNTEHPYYGRNFHAHYQTDMEYINAPLGYYGYDGAFYPFANGFSAEAMYGRSHAQALMQTQYIQQLTPVTGMVPFVPSHPCHPMPFYVPCGPDNLYEVHWIMRDPSPPLQCIPGSPTTNMPNIVFPAPSMMPLPSWGSSGGSTGMFAHI